MNALRERLRGWMERIIKAGVPIIALLLIGAVYFLGVRSERTGFVSEVLDPGLKRITRPVLNAFSGKPEAVALITVELEPVALDSLAKLQDRALLSSWTEVEHTVRFGAQVLHAGRTMPAVISLLEGPVEQDRRWAYTIRLLPGDTLMGMQSFDLIPVRDASALRAWFLQQALADIGYPTFGAAFVELNLPDGDPQLYLMQGAADETRIRTWGTGRQLVLRFDDGLLTRARTQARGMPYPITPALQADWMSAPIMVARPDLLTQDPEIAKRTSKAVAALEAFRAGIRPASVVFDVRSTARALALSDLIGAQAAFHWSALRMVTDSATGKMLFIPYRGEAMLPIPDTQIEQSQAHAWSRAEGMELQRRLFEDPSFSDWYIAYMDSFSRNGWLEAFMERMTPALDHVERIVVGEHPNGTVDRDVLAHDRAVIRRALRPADLALAYRSTTAGGRTEVSVANVHTLPIEVRGLIQDMDTLWSSTTTTLSPRHPDKPLRYAPISFPGARPPAPGERLLLRLKGHAVDRTVPVSTWSVLDAN